MKKTIQFIEAKLQKYDKKLYGIMFICYCKNFN